MAPAAALVRATSASWRTVHSLAWAQSSWSLSGVATSATARTLSKDRSPAQSDPTRCGRSHAFSPRRVSARAVGVETPKRSTAQASADVAPSSRYSWRRLASPKLHDDLPVDGRLQTEEPIEMLGDLLVRQGGCGGDHVAGVIGSLVHR